MRSKRQGTQTALKAVSSRDSLISSRSSDSLEGTSTSGLQQQQGDNRRPRRQRTFGEPDICVTIDGRQDGAELPATSTSGSRGSFALVLRATLLLSAFGLASLLLSASAFLFLPIVLPAWLALEVAFGAWLWLHHIPKLAQVPQVHAPTDPYCPSRSFDNFIRQASLQHPMETQSDDPSEEEEEEEEGDGGKEGSRVLRWQRQQRGASPSSSLAGRAGGGKERVVNPRFLLSSWFHGIDCSQLRLGNVAELLAHGFHFKSP